MKSSDLVDAENHAWLIVPNLDKKQNLLVIHTFEETPVAERLELIHHLLEVATMLSLQYANFRDESLGSLFGDPKTSENVYGPASLGWATDLASTVIRHWQHLSHLWRPSFHPLNINPYHALQLLDTTVLTHELDSPVSGGLPNPKLLLFDEDFPVSSLFCPLCHQYNTFQTTDEIDETLYWLDPMPISWTILDSMTPTYLTCNECFPKTFEGLGSLFG